MSQHGFARSSIWKLDSVVMDNEAGVSVRLGKIEWIFRFENIFSNTSLSVLEVTPEIEAVFPHRFSLAYVVTLATHQLSTDLHVENTSETSTLTFQSLLHTYFYCDASTVTVSPLNGLTYIDKTNNMAEALEKREEVDVRTYTDAVYKDAPGEYYLWYEGSANKGAGGIHIKTKGFKDAVVWNPKEEAGRAIADMEEGGWYVPFYA